MSFFDQAMTMKSAAGWPFPLRIVVATMDAYCKYKAGRLQGAARGVLDKLRTKLALVDESEAYALDQAVAGLGGIGAFETVVALGETRAKPRMLLRSTNFSLDRTYAHSPLYGISECSDDESYTDVDELYLHLHSTICCH